MKFLPDTDPLTSDSNENTNGPDAEIEYEPVLPNWQIAAWAADSKKAKDIKVLDLTEVTTFTDTFVICTASNSRQAQTITDAVQQALKKHGEHAMSIEGYEPGEWILSDYSDLIVHVFSETARSFYDLDRLWRQARVVDVPVDPDKREELPFSMLPPVPISAAAALGIVAAADHDGDEFEGDEPEDEEIDESLLDDDESEDDDAEDFDDELDEDELEEDDETD